MTPHPLPDDCDALALRCGDREAVIAALDAACREEGLVRAPAQRLRGYGHFTNGEEDPTLRRFLVSPPMDGWIVVLLSAQDWDHDWIPRLLRHLPVPAAYLMLHDTDTCTLHLYDRGELLADLCTSALHFDRPPSPPHPRLREALQAVAGRPVTAEDVARCCFPPGRVDVDGCKAHACLRELLGIPDWACGTYGAALEPDGRTPKESHADWIHACWQEESEALADEEFERAMARTREEDEPPAGAHEATVLPFRKPGSSD